MKVPEYTKPKRHKQCKSLADMAAHWGMAKRTLESWSQEGLIFPGPNGKWKSQDVARILKAKEADAEKTAKPESGEFSEEKIKWQAKRAKLEYEKAAGLVIDRSEVKRREREISQVFKAALIGVGRALAPQLEGLSQLEIARKLEDWGRATLKEIEDTNLAHGGGGDA